MVLLPEKEGQRGPYDPGRTPERGGQGSGLKWEKDVNGFREAQLHLSLPSCAHDLTSLVLAASTVKWSYGFSCHLAL